MVLCWALSVAGAGSLLGTVAGAGASCSIPPCMRVSLQVCLVMGWRNAWTGMHTAVCEVFEGHLLMLLRKPRSADCSRSERRSRERRASERSERSH